jgi:hypothetical protein
LGDGTFAFGRVLQESLVAFYDLRRDAIPNLDYIIRSKVAFKVDVMNYAITDGDWPILGNLPLEPELLVEPVFFKKDPITGELTFYRDSTQEEIPATRAQCRRLECAAVWEPEHVVERLNDHFAGRPNPWVESMRP